MEVYGVVYTIIDGTNDFEYIGQTTQSVEKRFNQHKRGDQYIDHVIQKCGADMFAVAILKVCYSKEELDFYERHMIRSRDTKFPNGYNRTDGGEGMTGLKFTPEQSFKLSAKQRVKSPFKNLLRELEKRQLTYTELKKLLGLSSVYAKMLGKEKFTVEQVDKLVEFFGLSAEYLLKRDDGENFMSKKYETPYKNLLAEMKKK